MRPGQDLDQQLREMFDDVPVHDDSARRVTLTAIPSTTQRRFRWLPTLPGRELPRRAPVYAGLSAALIVVVVVGALGLSSRSQQPAPGSGLGSVFPLEVVEGRIACGPDITNPTTVVTDVAVGDTGARVIEDRGGAYRLAIESMSDPRLDGTLTNQLDTDRYGAQFDAPQVGSLTWTIENEGGSWQTHFISFRTDPTDWATAALIWEGTGDYAGLAALLSLDYQPAGSTGNCGWELEGYVVSAELLPDFPTPSQIRLP